MTRTDKRVQRMIALLVSGIAILGLSLLLHIGDWVRWALAIAGLVLMVSAVAQILYYTYHLPTGRK